MQAASMMDDKARKVMLQSADVWDRMADYEERNQRRWADPARARLPSPGSTPDHDS